ncbi:MAG: transposase [Thermoleophilaceae bacterium]
MASIRCSATSTAPASRSAGVLREGRAGANTAADHLEVLALALAQIPAAHLDRPMLARSDSAGATHEFARALAETGVRFSLGYGLTEAAREAILAVAEAAWRPAHRPGRRAPRGRLGGRADRRRRAARVAGGHAADLPPRAPPPRRPALLHRSRGPPLPVPDHRPGRTRTSPPSRPATARTRASRTRSAARASAGLANLPFRDFAPNAVWLELVLMAQDLLAHTSALCLEGELARAEPKRLRQRVLHVAGRLTRSGRRLTLHLPRRWPWAQALLAAFGRLRSLPLLA